MVDLTTSYLAIEQILVYDIIGDPIISFIIGVVLVSLFSLKYRLEWEVLMMLQLTWVFVYFGMFTGFIILWVFGGLVAAITAYFIVEKKFKR
jgi:hypothetical protein